MVSAECKFAMLYICKTEAIHVLCSFKGYFYVPKFCMHVIFDIFFLFFRMNLK